MRNGVASEEIHSNAVAGAATATAVTQPPLDNTSLASLHLRTVLLSHQPLKIRQTLSYS